MMPEEWEPAPPTVGSASGASGDTPAGNATPWDEFVGNLWVPDPEQRHGWRDVWVKRQKPATEKPGWQGLIR